MGRHGRRQSAQRVSDGYPEAWWLPAAKNIPAGYATKGRLFDDSTGTNPGTLGYADYEYRNDQPAAEQSGRSHIAKLPTPPPRAA